MKLCSSSSPVCLGRGGGGQISLKHICSWMLMRGNTALGELIPMFSPPFAPPVLLARGTPWSWHGCSVPCSLQSWIFQEYTDEISIESSCLPEEPAGVCIPLVIVSLFVQVPRTKKNPVQVNFQIQSGWLLNNGTSQQHGGDLDKQRHSWSQSA